MFRIVSIVEGHGDVEALPVLIRRIIVDEGVRVEKPIRLSRGLFRDGTEFSRMIDLAARKTQGNGVVLILADADDDCPAEKGPELLAIARRIHPDTIFRVVLANREFESWFLAGADSLAGRRSLPPDLGSPENIESIRDAKGWLERRMSSGKYTETVDQPAFASLFDMAEAERRSDSFAKLMRDIRSALPADGLHLHE